MKKLLSVALLASLAGCSSSRTTTTRMISSSGYPIVVVGGDEQSFTPPAPNTPPVPVGRDYDVVVVGGGLSGLSASIFLSDAGKSVLLLEKEPTFGGLAQGTTFPGTDVRFDRGAAYWTDAYEEEQQILNRIGLGDFQTKHPIPEPIDSYFWNGKLYPGIWEKETMEDLPASFLLFFTEIQNQSKDGFIPDQPFEEAPHAHIQCGTPKAYQNLDCVDAATWIRAMPKMMARRRDKASLEAYDRFKKELASGKLDARDPMSGVVGLMDLYCRSALGTTSQYVSAVAFANFYISEIVTRYTTQIGTGQAAENMVKMLRSRSGVTLQASSPVVKIRSQADGSETQYVQDGKLYSVRSKYVVFSAQLGLAPRIVEGFAEKAPEQAALMSGMDYANYSVHAVEVQGHPYRVTYDTWTRSSDATNQDFTDVILGRWMDPELKGYEGYRDFRKDPPGNAIMSIYHPLQLEDWKKKPSSRADADEQAKEIATHAVDRMLELYNPLLQKSWGSRFNVISVLTSRWPYSVHIAAPGHFSNKVRVMRKPFGRVFFGNNNLGTPAFEEALFRGHCAADNVLSRLDTSFRREKWSKCPIEK